MSKITIIKDALKRLCINQYSLEDIRVFVNYLSNECIEYLKKSGEIKYILYHEHGNLEQKLEDYAIDIIGPLFARDEKGDFIILKHQFSKCLEDQEEKLESQIFQVLKTSVKRGMIQYYGDTDPIGKIFYRSLRYLLEKKKEWAKSELNAHGISISRPGYRNKVATFEDVVLAFHQVPQKTTTVKLREILINLIDQQRMSVPISFL